MTTREMVGWILVAAGAVCGVAAVAIKGGTFEALTAASAAFTAAAAMWGYANKPPGIEGMKRDGPSALATRAVRNVMRYAELS